MASKFRNRYDVYDKKKGEFILQNVHAGEVEKMTGLSSEKASTYAKKGYVFNKRYRIVGKTIQQDEVKITKTKDIIKLMNEWDRVISEPELWHTIDPNLLGEHGKKFKGW